MTITKINQTRAKPYLLTKDVAKEMGMCSRTAQGRIAEIKEEVKKGRYDEYAVIKDGGFLLVNYLVLIDYMKWRERLKDKNARKSVPPYEPCKVARAIGWYGNATVVE